MFLMWEHVTDLLEISQILLRDSSDRGETPLVSESKQIDSRRVLTFLVDAKILKNNIYWSDFFSADHFDLL